MALTPKTAGSLTLSTETAGSLTLATGAAGSLQGWRCGTAVLCGLSKLVSAYVGLRALGAGTV